MRTITLFLICAIMHGAAVAATCAPGFYLENGECKHCNPGYQAVYCPGDDTRHPCPITDTDYEKLTGMTKLRGCEANWASATDAVGATNIGNCYGDIYYRDSNGNEVMVECPFNGENYWCDHPYWYVAGPGYYLSGYLFTSGYAWYSFVRECTNAPANAHYTGPGTPDAPDGSVVDANDCPWECDAGYGKSASGECLPLCPSGATKFHAGEYIFNLWRDKYTSPSLNIQLPGGEVCYINLAPGGANATINVSFRDATYHVTN